MKAVILSIRPKWCEMIVSGKKTIEVRKTRPKLDTPFKCYIYCTKEKEYFYHGGIGETLDDLYRIPHDAAFDAGRIKFGYSGELMCCHAEYDSSNFLNSKIIGEFVCNKLIRFGINEFSGLYMVFPQELKQACLSEEKFTEYGNGKLLYGWNIAELKIFDKPRELGEFGLKKTPQSWCYVEDSCNTD